jgi:hypothetical protein
MAGMMLDNEFQTRQCQKLLASVVANAVRDLATAGHQREYRTPRPGSPQARNPLPMSSNAFTSARFLFDETSTGVDAYLEWLDMDVGEFRRRLLETIYDPSPHSVGGWDYPQRRAMRINYETWRKVRHGDTTLLEEDDDE